MEIHSRVHNQAFRDLWIKSYISKWLDNRVAPGEVDALDMGAGQRPYKEFLEALNIRYFSHDFNQYVPNGEIGLHTKEWKHFDHDFVCDILEIPENREYSPLILTEVLEHVQDPVEVLRKVAKLLKPDGLAVITAPLLSLIHQAPHNYATGFTQYFYRHWIEQVGLRIESIEQHGDYADLLFQEVRRLTRLPGLAQRPLSSLLRIFLQRGTLSSGGFSIFVAVSRPNG